MCNLSVYHYMEGNLPEPLVLRCRIKQGAAISGGPRALWSNRVFYTAESCAGARPAIRRDFSTKTLPGPETSDSDV